MKLQIIKGKPNTWETVKKYENVTCCDCGLTHQFEYRIKDNKIQIKGKRNERITNYVRAIKEYPKR